MKNGFLKTVLAVIVGMIIVGIISTMFTTCVFMGIISAASASGDETTVVTKQGDVMLLKINGEVTEVPASMPFSFDMLSGMSMSENLSLRGYVDAISCAKQDPNIAGIYLNTDDMTASPATYEALRDALVDFRSSGKWIIAYNDNYSVGQYYVASAADSLFVNTIGAVTLDGMSSVLLYPKGLLDKLGVEMQVFRVGTFKSAVEPYMVEHISEANRLQTETYLRNIWNVMMNDIAETRDLTVAQLDSLANLAVSYMQPDEIAETGLVDGQLYKSDVEQILLEKMGADKLEGHAVTAKQLLANYDRLFPSVGKEKIAVIYANGEIASERQGMDDQIYYESLIKTIRSVVADSDIKAAVLRVNSPGGSGFASEQIWRALMDLKETKPLVVSMGDYAASGGYYISCMADYIVAEPNTLTGSIGVFGVIPNFGGVAGKLGVNFEEVKTHKFGTLTSMRKASEAERAQVQKGVETFYELFTHRCAEGREMDQDSIKAIAGGRVWTGTDALNIGLVDELGGLDAAFAKAAELAGLEVGNCTRDDWPRKKTSMETLMELFDEKAGDISLRVADAIIGTNPADREALKFIEHLQKADRIQARSFDAVVY